MPLFWFLAAALLLGVLSVLLWPLLSTRRSATVPDADSAAIAVFRDQKRAVDADFESGAITGVERDVALADLAQRVAEEIGASPSPRATVPLLRPAWLLAIGLLLSIPVLAVVLYRHLGDPGAAAITAAAEGAHELTEQQVDAMVAALAQRLEQRPQDAEGWALLARSNYALGRFSAATDAYAKASALMQDNADLLADYADALAMTQGRQLAGKPVALIERALAVDPRHQKALALAATAAMEAREPGKSIAYWRRLAALLPPGSTEWRQVTGVIARLDGGAGAPVATQESEQSRDAASTAGTISGRVELSPALAAKITPTDTVFIFARAVTGPRMPLAVLRVPAGDLPKDFILDDAMGMAAGMKLSSASEVVVEARLSRTGDALPQRGDLFGRSAPIKPGANGLRITIDQVVP
ncbi:MAG: c-type cytochrome biogenesis protein CcmI [Betaproteobacteria bacterium]